MFFLYPVFKNTEISHMWCKVTRLFRYKPHMLPEKMASLQSLAMPSPSSSEVLVFHLIFCFLTAWFYFVMFLLLLSCEIFRVVKTESAQTWHCVDLMDLTVSDQWVMEDKDSVTDGEQNFRLRNFFSDLI